MESKKVICSVYIADCCDAGGIYHYELTEALNLILKDFTPIKCPMFLNIVGNRMNVVLRSVDAFNGDSATLTYTINDEGQLIDPSAMITTHGKIACHITDLDGEIYTANYISGSVCRQGSSAVEHVGCGPVSDRQDKAHCHFVSPSPDGKYILAVDLGNDTIYTYDKQLNEVATAKVPLGHGCRHLAYSNDGKYVFCVNELASTVSVFEYDDGVLTLTDTYDALPNGFFGNNTAAAIRVKEDYLYLSNRGHNSIVAFKINNGKLDRLSFTPSGGDSPRDFDIYNDVMVCTNESGEITLFKIEGAELHPISCDIKLEHPLCVVFK